MFNAKIFAIAVVLLATIAQPAEARIWGFSWGGWRTPLYMNHSYWLQSPSFNNREKSDKNEGPDIDDYLSGHKDTIGEAPKRETSSSGAGKSGLGDMKQKQAEMQAQMEKQRRDMEKQFEALNQKKDTPKPQSVEQPTMELPKLEAPAQQKMPELQPLPQLQQRELPQTPELPKLEQPKMDAPKQQEQANAEKSIFRKEENKEPAEIIVDDGNQKQPGQVVTEPKTETDSSFPLKKKIAVAVAVLFLVMGTIAIFSRK